MTSSKAESVIQHQSVKTWQTQVQQHRCDTTVLIYIEENLNAFTVARSQLIHSRGSKIAP